MKVLDATFLIDYLDGIESTEGFYEANGGNDERWVVPVPAYAEVLVGEGNLPTATSPAHERTSPEVSATLSTRERQSPRER